MLVHNFPISEDAGHTPQNLLAEYIDASRRSQRKRKCPSNEIADVGEDGGSDTDMNSFFDDDDSDEDDGDDGNEDMDFQAQPGNANPKKADERPERKKTTAMTTATTQTRDRE